MCRFLLIKSKQVLDPKQLLVSFADMAEKSRTAEGDRQGDGWGIAWFVENEWHEYKSLKPIWEDMRQFEKIPNGNLFAVHARSASFADQVGVLEYNQPFVKNDLCYVFNGVLKGVKLSTPVPGKIGAQKLFHLLTQEMKVLPPEESLEKIDKLMRENTKEIGGLNIAFVNENNLYALCDYGRNPDYFGIRYMQNEDLSLVCSESLPGFTWKTMGKGEVIAV
jgi:predicted glutamine amidotransferase